MAGSRITMNKKILLVFKYSPKADELIILPGRLAAR
jgi:hypothetical protein